RDPGRGSSGRRGSRGRGLTVPVVVPGRVRAPGRRSGSPRMTDRARKLILVGRVSGGFGVRGEVRISSYTAEPLAIARYGPLLREDGAIALTLTSARPLKPGEVAARA